MEILSISPVVPARHKRICALNIRFLFLLKIEKKSCFVYENASIVDVEYGPILVWEMETIFFVQFYLNPVEVWDVIEVVEPTNELALSRSVLSGTCVTKVIENPFCRSTKYEISVLYLCNVIDMSSLTNDRLIFSHLLCNLFWFCSKIPSRWDALDFVWHIL